MGVAASRRLIGAGHRLEAYAMLQLLLGLVDPLTGRVSRFKGPAALLVLNTRSVGWLPTALTNSGDAGPLAAALLGIAMGRAFDPRLCPILRGRLYLE